MIKNMEIEFKYSAEEISLEAFNSFCFSIKNHITHFSTLGVDKFYTNKSKPDTFFRIRQDSEETQLTYKRKTDKDDNFIRIEYNVDLKTTDAIDNLLEELGYTYDASINKVNHIHMFPWFVLAYYICFDKNMAEIGRFIEIEIREDQHWTSQKSMENELKIVEKMCRSLGISPEGRIKESLYEMYRSKP